MMPNKLASAKSPYLLEHANNPVEWHPWNDESLQLAKKSGKPILLSLGYSACHWCHVMAYESFEDEETAALMNKLFINIKVDREERPDLDKVYQLAHQLITQRTGGWPLTVFLTPDEQMPFYAGTYFPKDSDRHSVGFKQVLQHIAGIYHEKHDDISQLTNELQQAFEQLTQTQLNDELTLTDEPIHKAIQQLIEDFDEDSGGFGDAPKFPHPLQCQLLLTLYQHNDDPTIQRMLEKTLDAMALGGIYDQLGGGFFRYSTDSEWEIPHFEKMLYDTALLISTYCQAYRTFEKPLYKRIVRESCDWLIHSMQSPEGGFYATLNADSAGMEGGYYLWDKQQIKLLLNDKDFVALKNYFNLDEAANFEGLWHLYVHNEQLYSHNIEQAKQVLLEERAARLPPSCDNKILCGWNALAAKALYQASELLQDDSLKKIADSTLEMLCKKLLKHNRLYAVYKDGECYHDAYLDDIAYLLDAVLQKHQLDNSSKYKKIAKKLADMLISHYYDHKNGAFFFTADYHEKIIHRPKVLLDDATPAGNSVAASALWQYGQRFKNQPALHVAMQTLKTSWEFLSAYPAAHCSLLLLLLSLMPNKQH